MITPILPLDGSAAVAVSQYFFYFMIYSFLGWVLEGTYNLYSNGSFRKEGFLKGPFKPMYGFAPILLILAKELAFPLPLFLLLALVVPSVVEYVSGWLLKRVFHKQWWDYSHMSVQLQGHICLRFSLYWWVLSVACIYCIQPLMHYLYTLVQAIWVVTLPLVVIYFMADLLWTCWIRYRVEKELELGEG